jgi:hypothetical protein
MLSLSCLICEIGSYNNESQLPSPWVNGSDVCAAGQRSGMVMLEAGHPSLAKCQHWLLGGNVGWLQNLPGRASVRTQSPVPLALRNNTVLGRMIVNV